MASPEGLKAVYKELVGYQGSKTFSDGTLVMADRNETDEESALSVKVRSSYQSVSFEVTSEGLLRFSEGEHTVTLRSVLDPRWSDTLKIIHVVKGVAVNCTDPESYRGAVLPLANWFKRINEQGGYIYPAPLHIENKLDIYAINRSFERWMREVNPDFDISDQRLP